MDDLVELLWCVGHADDELRRERPCHRAAEQRSKQSPERIEVGRLIEAVLRLTSELEQIPVEFTYNLRA